MPFIASDGDRTVIPGEIDDGDDVWCRSCGERMRARGPFDDGTDRHFYHVATGKRGGCGGSNGESTVHNRWKMLAVEGLREGFPDQYRMCAPEISIGTQKTETDVDERRADVLLEFDEQNRFFGDGIIVEVQHLNAGKDIRATTHDCLKSGYSVYWADEQDFEDGVFDLERMRSAFNEDRASAFSIYRSDPPELDVPDQLRVSDRDLVGFTTADPNRNCNHEYINGDGDYREVCLRCGQGLEICYYSDHQERLVSSKGTLVPSKRKVLAVNLQTVREPVEFPDIEVNGPSVDCDHNWYRTRSLAWAEEKHNCHKCDSVLIVGDGRVVMNTDP